MQEESISMVHSYGRNHSLIELEDKNSIIEGKESCWTIKPRFVNTAIFHNGRITTNSQIGKLILTNFKIKIKFIILKYLNLSLFKLLNLSYQKLLQILEIIFLIKKVLVLFILKINLVLQGY